MDGADPTRSSAPPTAEPVCPRHPDRVSYVRCQRCERPVCPDCQRPASVGVQCVDCVREQATSHPTARTTFGGRYTDGRPLVTQALVAVTVVVFVLQLVPGLGVTQRLAYSPFLTQLEPWRLLTAAFLHQTSFLPHILFNMYLLWVVGPQLEQRFGRPRFAALYLLSAVGGSVGYLLFADPVAQSWFSAVVGASGAVFGLFGALLVVNRRLGLENRSLLIFFALNAAIGFFPGANIAWQSHLGGLVTGVLVAAVLVHAPRARRTAVQVGGLVGVGVLIVALAVVKLATV